MSELFKRIDTVFLKIKNFERAIEWYTTTLGLELRWRYDESGYAAFNLGETPLTLIRASEDEEFHPVENATFNFYTADIKETHNHLLNEGVEAVPIEDGGDLQWFWFKDLDGNKLEVCCFEE